jgi:acyl-CoA thioesterase-2
MHPTLREILTLERLDLDLFRGESFENVGAPGRLYGGQVMAQALMAAYATVENKVCHSLHSYFLLRGEPGRPIIFEVDRARDGGSFTTRRVIAVQEGRQIFNMAASFQRPESGFEHQTAMPEAAGPDGLVALADAQAAMWAELPEDLRLTVGHFPAEMRVVDEIPFAREGRKLPTNQKAWFRLTEDLGDDPRLHQAALAFCSDMVLLSSAARPHGIGFSRPGFQSTTLDHGLYFLHPTDMGQWHLHDMDSPAAAGARGLTTGSIYRQDGLLVATCTQEGLMRYRPPAEAQAAQ